MSNREIHNENRADQLNEDLLWGAPRSSDGAFLVSVRSRLNYQVSGLWLSTRNSFAIVGAAAVLLLGVWLPGQNSSQRISQEISDATLNTAVDEFVVDEVDPLDLADYLGVQSNEAEVTNEEAEPTTGPDQTVTVTDVSTDEILELNEQDFDLVIAEIQETEFF